MRMHNIDVTAFGDRVSYPAHHTSGFTLCCSCSRTILHSVIPVTQLRQNPIYVRVVVPFGIPKSPKSDSRKGTVVASEAFLCSVLLSCFPGIFTSILVLSSELQHLYLNLFKAQGMKKQSFVYPQMFSIARDMFSITKYATDRVLLLSGLWKLFAQIHWDSIQEKCDCVSCHIFPWITAVNQNTGLDGPWLVIFMLFSINKYKTDVCTLWFQPPVHRMSTRAGWERIRPMSPLKLKETNM